VGFLLVSFHSILANIFARQALIKLYLTQKLKVLKNSEAIACFPLSVSQSVSPLSRTASPSPSHISSLFSPSLFHRDDISSSITSWHIAISCLSLHHSSLSAHAPSSSSLLSCAA